MIKIKALTFMILISIMASSSANLGPRYWLAVGVVAHQCGKTNQPPIRVTKEDIINSAAKETGQTSLQITRILANVVEKQMVDNKVAQLKSDISNGYITCADIILGFAAINM